MEEHRHFLVITGEGTLVMMISQNINFDRDDFLDETMTYLFLKWFDGRSHVLFVLIREIIKNVFDHGIGRGTLTLIKNNNNYLFNFIDHNPIQISFSDCCKAGNENEWIKKSRSNCNVGISLIRNLGSGKGMTLSVDDTKGGINYFGSYTELIPEPLAIS